MKDEKKQKKNTIRAHFSAVVVVYFPPFRAKTEARVCSMIPRGEKKKKRAPPPPKENARNVGRRVPERARRREHPVGVGDHTRRGDGLSRQGDVSCVAWWGLERLEWTQKGKERGRERGG